MRIKMAALAILAMSMSGCAALEEMHQQWIKENCNQRAAYNKGVNDGLTPHKLAETNYAASCPADNDLINNEYARGFSEGLRSRPQEININKNVNVDERNVNVRPAASGYYSSGSSGYSSHRSSYVPASSGYTSSVSSSTKHYQSAVVKQPIPQPKPQPKIHHGSGGGHGYFGKALKDIQPQIAASVPHAPAQAAAPATTVNSGPQSAAPAPADSGFSSSAGSAS